MYWILIDIDGQALTFTGEYDMLEEYAADPFAFTEAIWRHDTGVSVYSTRDLDSLWQGMLRDRKDEARHERSLMAAAE